MMVVQSIEEEVHPELAAFEWLHKTDDKILACRGQGHNWPKLRPNKGRPIKGIRHRGITESQGQVEIIMTCRDCGTDRRVVTAPGGLIDLPAKYTYTHPDGYRAPKGVKITGRQAFAESNRRWLEDVAHSAPAAE